MGHADGLMDTGGSSGSDEVRMEEEERRKKASDLLSSSLGKLSRANEEINPLLRHPFPPSPCLRSPLFYPLCSQIFNHSSVVEEADPSARRSVF